MATLRAKYSTYSTCILRRRAGSHCDCVAGSLKEQLGALRCFKTPYCPPTLSVRNSSTGAIRHLFWSTFGRGIAFLAHSERTGRGVRDFRRELIHRAIRGCQLGAAFTVDHWNEVEDLIKPLEH